MPHGPGEPSGASEIPGIPEGLPFHTHSISYKSKKPPPIKIEPNKDVSYTQQEASQKTTTIDLSFSDLSYSVQTGIFRRGTRNILQNISGEFKAGELTAIMGPSGAGKSTLMDILTGYTSAWTGSITVNGYERDHSKFRQQSCYIMQDDHLQPLLTVQEAMNVAANLKLSPDMNLKEKQCRISQILNAIGLGYESVKKTRTGNLSGGQKKRLAIALELVSNPPVMFFDEPTSGLDSSSSKQCIALLQKLAREGRTIVCTIHQPSALLLEMFDHLYAVADGKCIYQGSIKGLVPYLGELNLHCPPYHNPADFFLEVSTGEYGLYIDNLVIKSENGKNKDWRRNQRDTASFSATVHINGLMSNGLITPVNAPNIPITPFSPVTLIAPNQSKEEKSPKTKYSFKSRHLYPTRFFSQVSILILRNIRMLTRDRVLTYMRFFIHMSIAILMGILYFQIGMEAQYMRDNFNFIFFSIMFLMFTAFNSMALSFPMEIPIIKREHFNRWYSLKAYYIAVTLTDAPIQLVSTLVYAVITFFLTGQPFELFRLFYFTVICILISLVAQGIGLLNGAIFSIQNGVIIGPLFMLPFTIFSGFFVHLHDAHPSLQWLFHVSYLKYGLEGAMLSIFGYNRTKLECNSTYCHYKYPSKFLVEVDMEEANYSYSIIALSSLCIAVRLLTYYVLYYRIRSRR
ncbi:ATP-binding cassette subfamily G member 4-like [Arctopsyche grandis]|uniref:ATP-binding cassette subfamily G member 4-like n=1 Tax=Arctopsyche grandis TaxID=121162 RepID=UPI00406D8C90